MIVQQINYNMGVAEWLCGLLGLCLRVYICLSVLDLVVVVVVCAISQLADIVRGVWVVFAVLLSAHCTLCTLHNTTNMRCDEM